MTNAIELSKRLLELAEFLETQGGICQAVANAQGRKTKLDIWIADIRALAIPEPVGERESMLESPSAPHALHAKHSPSM